MASDYLLRYVQSNTQTRKSFVILFVNPVEPAENMIMMLGGEFPRHDLLR